MAWENIIKAALCVSLRVPPLFLMDSVLNRTFLGFIFPYDPRMTWTQYVFWLCCLSFFFLFGLLMFVMSIRQLLVVYSYAGNFALLVISYWWNYSYVLQMEEEGFSLPMTSEHEENILAELQETEAYTNIIAQFIFSWLFYMAWVSRTVNEQKSNFNKSFFQTLMHVSFILPVLIRSLCPRSMLFQWSPMLSVIYPAQQVLNELLMSVTSILFVCRRTFSLIRVSISAIGIQAFIEDQWMRLNVPKVLRLFCILRIMYQLSFHVHLTLFTEPPELNTTAEIRQENVTMILQGLLVRSCETFVSLLGTTSIVSFIAHYIGLVMAFCVGSDTDEDRNMGTVSAILFFLLALQTGLTSLEPEKRLIRLYRNFSLLSSAILHFVHSMVNPILLSLSASRNMCLKKHLRVLGMCAFLVTYPICLVYYLWQANKASPWLLAVTAFSIEVIIKVMVSLTVYTLFIIDAYRDTFWEKLDDYIYYIQSTGNTIEFLFGIFMFCNGAWIMIFESGGAIRAFMMCIHAYLNIFVQAKEGWKVFIKRRTAVNKINSLREATTEDLESFNDVCAICYQELKTARVTRCNHYYHSVCLRKWLYVQDNCPLCHEVIYKPAEQDTDNKPQSTDNQDEANQNNMHVPNGTGVQGQELNLIDRAEAE